MENVPVIDYVTWDWLPAAAAEMQAYVTRVLAESGIQAHDVTARPKSIGSFERKVVKKQYGNPMKEVTDIVAVRIITYSVTDRDRVTSLLRARFEEKEYGNPGEGRDARRRGYDCLHLVVVDESEDLDGTWLVAGGPLRKYFDSFGGLEIQVRTVASHAWAEFEHARRYKGAQYEAVSEQDQETIDQLFGAASDARRALDETFVAIDRILARPSMQIDVEVESSDPEDIGSETLIDAESLASLLDVRFENDGDPTAADIEFGLKLIEAQGLKSVEALERALEAVDSEQVRNLMGLESSVTKVRRLDDELLAHYGEEYIAKTGTAGGVRARQQLLEARFDRLRGKARYKTYLIRRDGRPDGPFTAAGVVRELAKIIAEDFGIGHIADGDRFSAANDLPKKARAREVRLSNGSSIWVIANLTRGFADEILRDMLASVGGRDLQVERAGRVVASARRRE